MQPAGPHQLQLSKSWGNQEKLFNVGRLRGFAPNCANFCLLQVLVKNVNCISTVQGCIPDTLFLSQSLPLAGQKKESLFIP